MRTAQLFMTIIFACLMAGLPVFSATAGQVVTTDLKKWADETIKQEKQLSAITKPKSVAVLYFQNHSKQTDLDPLQKGLAVMLISDLSKIDVVTVVERSELQALVEELGFGQSGLVTPESAPRVGRLLQAEYLIGGSITRSSDNQLTIGADLLEVGPGKSVGRVEAKGTLTKIFDLEKKLLDQIVNNLKLDLTASQKTALNEPLTKDPNALMNLSKAIDASDHQQYDKAAQFYDQALRQDPDLTIAKTSLLELRQLKLTQVAGIPGAKPQDSGSKEDDRNLEQRRRLLHTTRQKTSFTTRLEPATPLARIPSPPAVEPIPSAPQDTRIGQPVDGLPPVN